MCQQVCCLRLQVKKRSNASLLFLLTNVKQNLEAFLSKIKKKERVGVNTDEDSLKSNILAVCPDQWNKLPTQCVGSLTLTENLKSRSYDMKSIPSGHKFKHCLCRRC